MKLSAVIAANGLTLDILGAYILARAATDRTDRRIRLESRSYLDYSGYLVASGVKARIEGRTALVILSLGFFFQLAALFEPLSSMSVSIRWSFSPIFAVLAALAAWRMLLRLRLRNEIARVVAPLDREVFLSDEGRQSVNLDVEGMYLKSPRLPNESDDDYWTRLKSRVMSPAPSPEDDFRETEP